MANGTTNSWGSDVPISLPEAPPADIPTPVKFGGFAFGPRGLVPDLTKDDLDTLMTPFFVPVNPPEDH